MMGANEEKIVELWSKLFGRSISAENFDLAARCAVVALGETEPLRSRLPPRPAEAALSERVIAFRRRRRRSSAEAAQAHVELVAYKKSHPGMSAEGLSKKFRVARSTVYRLLKHAGLESRPMRPVRPVSPNTNKGRIIEILSSGPATTPELASVLGIPSNRVSADLSIMTRKHLISRTPDPSDPFGARYIYRLNGAARKQ